MRFCRLLRSSFDYREPASSLRPQLRLRERGGQTVVKMKEKCQRAGAPHYLNQAERPVPSRHPASLYALAANMFVCLFVWVIKPSSKTPETFSLVDIELHPRRSVNRHNFLRISPFCPLIEVTWLLGCGNSVCGNHRAHSTRSGNQSEIVQSSHP